MIVYHPELEALDREFRRVLELDDEPAADVAILWHEAVAFNDKTDPPTAMTRGGAFLKYLDGSTTCGDVPGQDFPDEKLPKAVCSAAIEQGAGSADGAKCITFRYDLAEDGTWTGGFTVETLKEYRDRVAGRRDLDTRLADALRRHFGPGVSGVSLLYGIHGWEDPGPMLKIKTKQYDFLPTDETTQSVWEELVGYLKKSGVKHIYRAEFRLQKKSDQLREGDNATVRYSQ